MEKRNFFNLLDAKILEGKFVCVGLDSDYEKIPKHLTGVGISIYRSILTFNKAIVDSTSKVVACYKLNIAFYEKEGNEGLKALKDSIEYIKKTYPSIPIILDCKRGDIGNTNTGYIEMAFNLYGADAVTLHPYMGKESLSKFLALKDKGFFILCRTSNPGAGEFQDLLVAEKKLKEFMHLYEKVAFNVKTEWNENGNCGLVAGATYPADIINIRKRAGNMLLLIPGVGKQLEGKSLSQREALLGVIRASLTETKKPNFVINSSRGIIFASSGKNFAQVAYKKADELHTDIWHVLKSTDGGKK